MKLTTRMFWIIFIVGMSIGLLGGFLSSPFRASEDALGFILYGLGGCILGILMGFLLSSQGSKK